MKRISAIFLAVLLFVLMPVVSFADDIYIVDDEEEVFVPVVTTTKPAETTTAAQTDSILGDIDLEGYFGEFSGMLGDGIDSLLSSFEEGFGDFNLGGNSDSEKQDELQPITPGENTTVKPVVTTKAPEKTEKETQSQIVAQESATQKYQEELPSVLIVNQIADSSDKISGSTLTILVFVVAVVLIILTGAIVLVLMTKRTEYNSSVKSRSTIPGVEQPTALAQFMNDDIKDDGKDYGNIAYWNEIR